MSQRKRLFGRLKQANKDLLRGLHDAEQRIACLGMGWWASGMARDDGETEGDQQGFVGRLKI